MSIYLLILFIVILLAFIADKLKQNSNSQKIFIFLILVTLVLFAGFRSRMVGTDTNNYIGIFESNLYSYSDFYKINSSIESGYLLINLIIKSVSNSYIFLLLGIAIIVVSFYLKAIYKYSEIPYISIFLLICLGFYTYFFNGARQGIALAIYSMSIGPLLRGNYIRYCFWVILASFFHISILIALPLYYFFRMKYSIKYVLLISLIFVVIIISFNSIINISNDVLSERYSEYLTRGSSGAELLTFFYGILTILLISIRQWLIKSVPYEFDIFLNMIIFATMIYIMVYALHLDVNILRIATFFHLAIIFILPVILIRMGRKSASIFKLFIFIMCLIFFIIYTKKMSNLIPYHFNPEISNLF